MHIRFALCAVLLTAVTATADDWHPHADIRAAAVAAARASATGPGAAGAQFEADRPDPRLRLARCGRPLETDVSGGARSTSGRLLVEVRCSGARPWRLYLPVEATLVRPVLVTARPLARDSILTADDIRLADREVTALARGFVADQELVVGRRLRRSLGEGVPLTPSVLDAAVLVQRGQRVMLEARNSGLAVSMAGVARSDGALGETIAVENLSSGRRLDGIVRSARSVEVLLR